MPLLDPESILALARFHEKIPAILQGTFIRNQFIRRFSPLTDERSELENVNQQDIEVVRCLVAILKLMKSPEEPRQDLLELICEKFLPQERG